MQSSSTGPQPPTGLTVVETDDDTAVVSWEAQQSRACDVVMRNYSVRYQLGNDTGGINTVYIYTSSANVTLRGLQRGAQYTVSVAAINSRGNMSTFSALVQFTVIPTAPSKSLFMSNRPLNMCPYRLRM